MPHYTHVEGIHMDALKVFALLFAISAALNAYQFVIGTAHGFNMGYDEGYKAGYKDVEGAIKNFNDGYDRGFVAGHKEALTKPEE